MNKNFPGKLAHFFPCIPSKLCQSINRQLYPIYSQACGNHRTHTFAEHRDDITIPDELIKRVHSLDNIYADIVASKEAAIDSEAIRLLSSIGREQVETTHGELIQFDTTSYAEKLVTFMGGRRGGGENARLDWEKLGERAMKAFRKPPTVSFL